MKTLFVDNTNFAAFEILTSEELNLVKGGNMRGRDVDFPVEP